MRPDHWYIDPAVGSYPTVIGRLLLRAGRQLFFLDREDLAGLELEVADNTGTLGDVDELGVVAAGRRIRDPQPLVRINGAVAVVLALVGPPVGGAGGRQIELRNSMASQIPEPHRPVRGDRR